ncbi:hypothetical protein [Caulobacter sp. 17J65-9]|uniref:hypothetical protein n=1 Tax=Caulobacter sp. 17J65-9 TaxID=2709382 RepID=UPI0013C76094|nr:hypothetical protein [Caulobacter sp. 17J65-9]NEX91916.1 hypothetical protein [Caulobacter sp. 17J65-9]
MYGILALAFILVFVAAQGAVIFATALLALRLLKTWHWLAKIVAMLVAYLAWTVATIGAYFAAGGEGGLMDGGAILLQACFTALVSTLGYLALWIVWPLARVVFRSRHARPAR